MLQRSSLTRSSENECKMGPLKATTVALMCEPEHTALPVRMFPVESSWNHISRSRSVSLVGFCILSLLVMSFVSLCVMTTASGTTERRRLYLKAWTVEPLKDLARTEFLE